MFVRKKHSIPKIRRLFSTRHFCEDFCSFGEHSMCLQNFATGWHENRLIRNILRPFDDKNFVIKSAVGFGNPVSQRSVMISSS